LPCKKVELVPEKVLLDLAQALQSSSNSLPKLKIKFGSFSPADQQDQKLIIEFLKTLSNIQVLELPDLQIEIPDFFAQIVEVISSLRYIREFALGDITNEVPSSEYKNSLKTLITKRGLRKFKCNTAEYLLKKCGFEDRHGRLNSLQIDLNKVEMRNPFLESIYLHSVRFPSFHFDLLKKFSEFM